MDSESDEGMSDNASGKQPSGENRKGEGMRGNGHSPRAQASPQRSRETAPEPSNTQQDSGKQKLKHNRHAKQDSAKQTEYKQSGGKKVSEQELDAIIERLYTSTTKSLSCQEQPYYVKDIISRPGTSSADVKEITNRLASAHTKSSSGGVECKAKPELTPIGYGLKSYPTIEGIETRFKGNSSANASAVSSRLMSAQTRASKSRLESPAVLLYPERTMLMNEPERIRAYQTSGDMSKQGVLGRREKWYY